MRATYIYGAGDIRVINVPDPVIEQPTDAMVRVVRACICGSDLHPYHNMPATAEGSSIGHECIGSVEETGAEVTSVSKGDLVIVPFAWSDGTCDFCREGLQTSCRHGGFWNAGDVGGGQAEAIRVPLADGTLVATPVEEDSPLIPSLLTLSDVYGTGYHAAIKAGVNPPDKGYCHRRRSRRSAGCAVRPAARSRADHPHGTAYRPHRPRPRIRRHRCRRRARRRRHREGP
jgi:threonine dehydrogenase-like Zn-dependent dehydrogenase